MRPIEIRRVRATIVPVSLRTICRLGAISICALSLGIIADAAKSAKTAPSSSRTQLNFASFVQKLNAEGEDNPLRPNTAPFLALPPNAPSKAYVVDTLARQNDRQPEKLCKLVLEKSESTDKLTPMCLVLIDGYTGEESSEIFHYKVGLDGKLLAAIRLTGKNSDGKPVRGSGVKTDLDINSPEVQASFKRELDFWLSGKYKKYWKPKVGVKTAQN